MSALGRLSAGGLAAVTARRLAVLLATLLALSFVVYALLELAPGSAEQTLLSGQRRTPETVQAVRDRYHLDEPFLQRYGRWLGDAVRLEFGVSARTQRPVTAMIGERLPLTLQLGAGALLASLLLAVPLGMLAAVRQRSRLDRALVWLSVITGRSEFLSA
jgi:peptide/nickel transport system permease protein